MNRFLIGGSALYKLGSSRYSKDLNYLTNEANSDELYIFDKEKNILYLNANGHPFFKEIWELEKNKIAEMVSPQSLLELKAFALVQHTRNKTWSKVDDCDFDIKFLVRNFHLTGIKIANKYITPAESNEVNEIIKNTRK